MLKNFRKQNNKPLPKVREAVGSELDAKYGYCLTSSLGVQCRESDDCLGIDVDERASMESKAWKAEGDGLLKSPKFLSPTKENAIFEKYNWLFYLCAPFTIVALGAVYLVLITISFCVEWLSDNSRAD